MNRVSLTLGLSAMDACWVVPWCVLLGQWAGGTPLLGAPTVFGLLLIGALTTQSFGRYLGRTPRGRAALASLSIAAAMLAVRVDQYPDAGAIDWIGPLTGAVAAVIGQLSTPVLAFAIAMYVWWRGVRIGSQTPNFTDTETSFRWGIGRLVAFGLAVVIAIRPGQLAAVESQTTPYVVGFFFVGLVTLALGRLESLRTRTRTLSINSQWFSVLIVLAGGVVLLALLLAQLVSFDVLLTATRPLFDLLGYVLLLVIYAIVIPLSYVIQWLIYLVMSLLEANPSRQPPQPIQPTDVNDFLQRFINEQVPPGLLVALKAAGAALLVGIALLIIARSLKRWRPSSADADATNEERDSLWTGQRWRELLLAWLKRIFHRRALERASVGRPATIEVDAAPTHVGSVRALYAELLRLGEAAGAPRARGTTPLEHEPALTRTLEPTEAVHALTAAYLEVRYAEHDLDPTPLRSELESVKSNNAIP